MRAIIAAAILLPCTACADVLTVTQVTDHAWALIGPLTNRDAQNLGNNATFGVILTGDGVVLVDPGGSALGAQMIDAAIDTITDAPVTHVIDTGGQDHRWLGNGYWQAQGAQVIASAAAVKDQRARASVQMTMLSQLIGDGLAGTEPAYADVTFDTDMTLTLGDTTLILTAPGTAHTPGDAFVWYPAERVVFTGDIVFSQRLLGVLPVSEVKSWIDAFDTVAALAPDHVVPGHGAPTDLATATRDTYDYLVNLRVQIGALIENGGDIIDAPTIDQSGWSDLQEFGSLAGRNAQQTYEQMEWE